MGASNIGLKATAKSYGPLVSTFAAFVKANQGAVSVIYSTSADMPGADAQDKEYLFIYQPDTKQGILSAPALRTTGTIEVRVPSTWTGLTVHVYGFGLGDGRENKGKNSDSCYIGTGIIG